MGERAGYGPHVRSTITIRSEGADIRETLRSLHSETTTSVGAAGVGGGSALTSSRSAERHYVTDTQQQATLTRLLGVCPVMKRA